MKISKCCTKCRNEYPATPECWHRKSSGKHGLAATCKECVGQEKMEYSRRPDVRKRVSEYHAKWRESNREKLRQSNSKWYRSNPEKGKKWRESNREKVVEYRIKSNRKAVETLSDSYIAKLLACHDNVSVKEIRQHPELIECQRIILKTKRLINNT